MTIRLPRLSNILLLPVALLGALLATAAPGPAQASEQQAAQFIHQLSSRAIETLRTPDLTIDQRRDAFRDLLIRGFDISFIGRFVLGPYWRGATAAQRGEYLALYGEFFLASYAARIGDYAGQTITVIGVRKANARDMIVRSSINRPGRAPITTDWRVRSLNGRYRVIDVMVEGISMAVTQRAEFASVAQRNGIDGLTAILRARTATGAETASLD